MSGSPSRDCRRWSQLCNPNMGRLSGLRTSNAYYMAGVLLTNVHASAETTHAVFNPQLGTWTGLIPQAGGQFRAYFVYPKSAGYRLQGESMLGLFVRESAKGYPPIAEYCADAKSIGPLASFDASDIWVEHPYRDGVALAGDAAATTDPTYGQGLSFALRAARGCATSSPPNPIGTPPDTATSNSISAVFKPATRWRAGYALFSRIRRRNQQHCGPEPCRLSRIPTASPITFLAAPASH